MGQYLLRSLMSEGRLTYATVEKLEGELKTVVIEKEGPTNFVTTTTSPETHAENETRIWSLLVDDTEATTERVHAMQAKRAAGEAPSVDTTPWLQAQQWLTLAGAREAVIPFAPELAKRMPRKPLRLRRDFERLLSLIQVIAILHQVQREKDAQGRVIATLADYAMARALVEAVFKRAVQGVTEKTLTLVRLIDDLLEEKGADSTVSYADLVAKTGRPNMWVSRWLKPALQLGLVENLEGEKGKAAQLIRGKFRLEQQSVLPSVRQMAQAVGESVQWVEPLTGEPQTVSYTPPSPGTDTVIHPPDEPEKWRNDATDEGEPTVSVPSIQGDTAAACAAVEAIALAVEEEPAAPADRCETCRAVLVAGEMVICDRCRGL